MPVRAHSNTGAERNEVLRVSLRWFVGLGFAIAGVFHILSPPPFLAIMPGWVPHAEAIVFWTGIAELLGAAALLQRWSTPLRRAGATGLALYAICVFPANINHLLIDMARHDGGWGMGYHIPRLLAQPLIVWLALWAGGVTDWPFRRRKRPIS